MSNSKSIKQLDWDLGLLKSANILEADIRGSVGESMCLLAEVRQLLDVNFSATGDDLISALRATVAASKASTSTKIGVSSKELKTFWVHKPNGVSPVECILEGACGDNCGYVCSVETGERWMTYGYRVLAPAGTITTVIHFER